MSQSYEELLSQVRGGRQVTADSRKAAPGCVFVAVRGAYKVCAPGRQGRRHGRGC